MGKIISTNKPLVEKIHEVKESDLELLLHVYCADCFDECEDRPKCFIKEYKKKIMGDDYLE